jgi:hypothetical protein
MPNTATGAQAAKHLSLTASEFAALIKAGTITAAANGKFSLDKVRGEFCVYAQKTMAASDAATAVQAAQHIHLGPSRFRDLVASGVFSHATRGNYSLNKVREEYCSNATKVMAGRAADGGASLSKQRARLATAQAEKAERANAIEAGEFVAVKGTLDDIDRFVFRPMREIVLNIAGKCSDSVATHSELDRGVVFEILMRECRTALTLMSQIGNIIDDQAKHVVASEPKDNDDNKSGDTAGETEPEKDIE